MAGHTLCQMAENKAKREQNDRAGNAANGNVCKALGPPTTAIQSCATTNTTTNTTTRWHFGELGVVSESTGVAANLRMDGSGCRRRRFDAASLQVPLSVLRSDGLEATHVELSLSCVGLRCEVVSNSFNELQRWGDSCELRSPGPCRVRAWPRRALPL